MLQVPQPQIPLDVLFVQLGQLVLEEVAKRLFAFALNLDLLVLSDELVRQFLLHLGELLLAFDEPIDVLHEVLLGLLEVDVL